MLSESWNQIPVLTYGMWAFQPTDQMSTQILHNVFNVSVFLLQPVLGRHV